MERELIRKWNFHVIMVQRCQKIYVEGEKGMKKRYYMLLVVLFGILLTAKPADAKVNETLLKKYKDVYHENKYDILYDEMGNVYLQWNGDGEAMGVALVSTPDAKPGKTALVIPESVTIKGKTYLISTVGSSSWYEVSASEEEEIFTIGTGYKKVIFGKNVEFIETGAFHGHGALEEIQFLGEKMSLQDSAFMGCEKLKKIIGSEKVSFIGRDALSYTAITDFQISKGCDIRAYAFANCEKLRELPDISKASELGQSVFLNCKGLKRIAIPNGVKILPEYTFSGCSNLKEVYIPKSVKEIGEDTFRGCTKLKGNVTIDSKSKYFTAKDNMILNKKGDTLLSMISPVRVMVIPSYVKKVKAHWAQDVSDFKKPKYSLLKTIVVQNKDIRFLEDSVPCWYSPGYPLYRRQKINILYPDTRDAFKFTKKQIEYPPEHKITKLYNQRPYTLYPAPARVKAKLKKGKVQVSFKKLKKSAVKKYKITYRIKKNGKYQAQKEKVIKGKRAMLCSLKKGESCEVRVSAYTKQSGVWVPGKFSRMVKVRRK